MNTPSSGNASLMTKNSGYPSTGYSWYVVVILFFSYTLAFVDRAIILFLIEPIKGDLQINDLQFSLLSTLSFSIVYTIMGIPFGRLADSRSRRAQLAIGIALWSGMTVLCGRSTTYWQLFFSMVGVGVGEACLVPCAYSMVADYFPREKRGLPLNVLSNAIMFGTLVSNIAGGVVSQYAFNMGPIDIPILGHVKPWQLSFIMVGVPGIFLILAMLSVKEPVRKEQSGPANFKSTISYVVKHWKTYGSIIGGTTFGAMTNGAMLGWTVAWFTRRGYGWDNAMIGTYSGITFFIFGSLGLLISGTLANYFISKGKKAVYIKLMIAAESLVLIPVALAHAVDNPYWVLSCMGGTIFFGGVSAGLGPASLQSISPNEMRGQITALCFLILGLVSGPVGMSTVGFLTDYVFKDPMMVRSSAVITGLAASAIGVIVLRLGLKAYEHTAGETNNK
jgi:MFS family permease